jgi:hypothetical protein
MKKAISAANLFKEAPTLHFYPENKSAEQADVKVLKSRKKKVVTLDIGSFHAVETILVGSGDNRVYHSNQLRCLTAQRCTYGYDVLVYVGYALFLRNCSQDRIIEELARRNVSISQREVGFLGRKFIAYLAIAHQQSRQRLMAHMALRGGYILHMDGTCEGDSPHLFTGIDGIANIVLDNIKLPSEKAELIIPFLRRIQRQYGEPIALVHDMGQGILSAVKTVFKGTPDFICHFHFLRDIGKDLFDKDYSKIRTRLKKHKIRGVLRQKAKALEKIINDDPKAVRQLLSSLDTGQMDPSLLQSMPAMAAYAMIHWAFDTSDQLDGYGFPFDCPHLIFYQRLTAVHGFVSRYSASGRRRAINNRALLNLWRLLTKVIEDQQLTRAASHMKEKMDKFKKLRKALAIAVPEAKKGLNDDGLDADIKSIEEKIAKFRKEIMDDEKCWQKGEYKKMIEQIDKYWEKLFTDPITVNTPNGQITIQPHRTNNILERFFRDFKRGSRKKSGTIFLNRTLRSMLADTPLVKNLDNPEYMKILLNSSNTLEECFAKIDTNMVIERLKTKQSKTERVNTQMKKIIRLPDLPERMIALVT